MIYIALRPQIAMHNPKRRIENKSLLIVTNQTVYVPLLRLAWQQSHLSFSCNYEGFSLKQSCERQNSI